MYIDTSGILDSVNMADMIHCIQVDINRNALQTLIHSRPLCVNHNFNRTVMKYYLIR